MVIQLSTPIENRWIRPGARGIQNLARMTADGSPYSNDLQVTPWAEKKPDGSYHLNLSVSLQQPFGEARIRLAARDVATRGRFEWTLPERGEERGSPALRLPARLRDPRRRWASRRSRRPSNGSEARATPSSTAGSPPTTAPSTTASEPAAWATMPASVTDPSCRVRGVDGLFVVDASTIPRVPRSNTHLVVVALAERAAALLSERPA